jgi:hypothetical protein
MLNNNSFNNPNSEHMDEAAFVDSFFLPGGILDDIVDDSANDEVECNIHDDKIRTITGTTTGSMLPIVDAAVTPSRHDLYSIPTIPLDTSSYSPWRSTLVDVTTPSPIQDLLGMTTQSPCHVENTIPTIPFHIPMVGTGGGVVGGLARSRLSDDTLVFPSRQQQEQHLIHPMALSATSPPFHGSTGILPPISDTLLPPSTLDHVVAPPGFESTTVRGKIKERKKPAWAEIASSTRVNTTMARATGQNFHDFNSLQQQSNSNNNSSKDEQVLEIKGENGYQNKNTKIAKSPDSSIGNEVKDIMRNRKGVITPKRKVQTYNDGKRGNGDEIASNTTSFVSYGQKPSPTKAVQNTPKLNHKKLTGNNKEHTSSLTQSPKGQQQTKTKLIISEGSNLKDDTITNTATLIEEKSTNITHQIKNNSNRTRAKELTNIKNNIRKVDDDAIKMTDVFDDKDFVVISPPRLIPLQSDQSSLSVHNKTESINRQQHQSEMQSEYASSNKKSQLIKSTLIVQEHGYSSTIVTVADSELQVEDDNLKHEEAQKDLTNTNSFNGMATAMSITASSNDNNTTTDGFTIRYIQQPITALFMFIITIYHSIAILILAIANIFKFASDESTSHSIGGLFWASPSVLCYYVFCLMPIVCNWLMTYVGNLPHFTPHLLSNLSVYCICRMISQVSAETTSSTQRRKANTIKRTNHTGTAGVNNSNNISYCCNSSTNVLTDFGNDVCQMILQIVKLLLPLLFFIEGFDKSNSSFMLYDAQKRMILAYLLSLVKRGLILSPIAWVGWSIQILLSSYLPAGSILNSLLFFIGLAFIRLVSLVQTSDITPTMKLFQ